MLDVGYVTPAGQDVLPSTGSHLDVRVLKDGKYIDPSTIRSLLTNLKVGQDKKPLWQQQGENWAPSYQITSGYGKRDAPTKGASTFHPAHDYGIPGGVPLAWSGPGTFTPGNGYGTINTVDPQGNPYEIRLLHTKGGKPGGSNVPQQPVQKPGDTYIFVRGPKSTDSTSASDFLNDWVSTMISQGTPQVKSMVDPVSILSRAMAPTQDYFS